jgi:hypothetical protein
VPFPGYQRLINTVLPAFLLSGCGTNVPTLHEFYDSNASDTMIDALIEHVQCELKDAVQFLILDDKDAAAFKSTLTRKPELPSLSWLYKWAAQVTLVITVDEKSSLNPSIFFTPPLPSATAHFSNGTTTTTSQSLSVGLGATVSVDATRKATISWLVKFEALTSDTSLVKAKIKLDYFYNYARQINSEKIPPTSLLPATVRAGILGDFSKSISAEASASKKDALQNEITFVVLYGGSINPVWKLLRIAGGQAPLRCLTDNGPVHKIS